MKYYAVVLITVTNDAWINEYLPRVSALVSRHGGNYLARTQTMERVEGDGALPSIVAVIEWPSKDAAQAFYKDPEYQPYLRSRLEGTHGDFLLVAGEVLQ